MKRPVRVLIVEDERLARLNMKALIEQHADMELVGLCASGREAIEMLEAHAVDLLLLDVHMPGMTGLDVVRALEPEALPFVVFVTAYERHALAAFELAAIDYLLKPVSRRRLAETLHRVRSALATHDLAQHRRGLSKLISESDTEGDNREGPQDRLVIRTGRRRRVVPFADVRWFEAWGNYVRVHTSQGEYLHRATLARIERLLPAESFVRVHRSSIVRVDSVRMIESRAGGGYVATLDDGSEVVVARRRAASVRALLRESP